MKHRLITACVLVVALIATDAAAKRKQRKEEKVVIVEGPGDLYATFTTSAGDIVVKLYEADAPKTVETFVGLATGKKEWKNPLTGKWENRPLYDGTYFHRVIPQFMIQGGDPFTGPGGAPDRAGAGGPGFRFADELGNGHKFNRGGFLAMANSGPDTNGSQFFITEVATPHLDDHHTIFGEVVWGQELVAQIAAAGNMKTQLIKVTIARGKAVKQ
jgi:peptidyl-prolyl cis-trans isomerase A (cyclophilin A)